MLAVELLERVIRQNGPVNLLGNAQQERIPAPDGPGWWMDVLAPQHRLLEAR
jgi:hypothetical protein